MFQEVLIGTALLFHVHLYQFYLFIFFLEGGDLIIVVLIILIFGHTRSGKGKKHQKHPRSPQPTPQKAGPGGHTGGWILP